jgi:hypothetical protein
MNEEKNHDGRSTKGGSYSGAHKMPRRKLSQRAEDWLEQDAAAARSNMTWAQWARAMLKRAANRG